MNEEQRRAAGYRQAVEILPPRLLKLALSFPEREQALAEEVRLRAGQPLMVQFSSGERSFPLHPVTTGELLTTLETATQASYHAVLESLKNGFFTLPGGHRLGVCGSAVVREGEVMNIKNPSSLCLRLAHETRGAAEGIWQAFAEREFPSTLILSPPGVGKTTFLRDLVRLLSDRGRQRVSLVDERCEVAALYRGEPQLDVGCRTDVLEGCPKAKGILMLLRSMAPQVLALDEVTGAEDLEAMRLAAHCGVKLLATAHAAGPEDLERRPLYRRLVRENIFTDVVVLENQAGRRSCRLESLGGAGHA